MSEDQTLGKGKPCQTKLQLTFENIDPSQPQTLNLGEYTKTKEVEEGETTVTFMVQFKGNKKVKGINTKKPKPEPIETYCPQAGETLTGDINGIPVSATIQKQKGGKPTKVTIDLGLSAPTV